MKTVIVTGASGNLGRAVINRFLAEGYFVHGTVISNGPVPCDIQDERFEKAVVDLLNEEDAERFTASVIARQGAIHAAVLTVGGFAMGDIAATKASDIFKQYRLNFETAYNIARPVFVQMLKQGTGRIFMIGSKPGLQAGLGTGMTAYSLGKSLIFHLAELMNNEAKGTNVVTSVLVPSTIDTPQNRKAMPDADFADWVKTEDIAETICYYCSEKAKAIREPLIKVYNNA
ncbi:MAG: SDR family NAD(P)-dependent oxidoreductase [Chitinophagaceae bacterium]|nr:SDR family NAD(P)-dependent oxidoreductase [Chitinophagaceae bacterium]